jgi:polysaccharide biosynthesis transport protein
LEVDLRQLARSALKWWWLLVALPVVLATLAFLYTSRQAPLYLAEVSLEVRTSGQENAYDALLGSERQAKTYQRLVKDQTVLENAGQQLTPPVDPDTLALSISSRVESDTSLLIIGVSDTDPAQAATIANLVGQELVSVVEGRIEVNIRERTIELQQRIEDLKTEIDGWRDEIIALEQSSTAASPEVQTQIADLNEDITRAQDNIELFQTQIGTIIANPGDSVRVFSNAVAPNEPYAPRTLLNLVLGVLAGLTLAAGLVLLLQYLDNTVKATLDFPEVVGGPLLATVRAIPKIKPGRGQLFMIDDPKSVPAESIRLLRTNIEFASATRELVTISLTSANPGEGKSTIAANLAVALAQAGFMTAIIDADLRRPTQHRIFELQNDRGLSTLLAYPEREWKWASHPTMLPNLTVIPAGPIPPNPADLLSLDRLRQILADLRTEVDVIIIDSPPVLAVSDPLIIAAHVDGVALVTIGGKTRLDTLKRAAQVLQRGAPRILGVVLNQQTDGGDGGYYYQEYNAVADGPKGFRKRKPAVSIPDNVTEQGAAD